MGRTPEAARSRMSTVVLPVVDDVAAAEGGGVIVAVVVPGLSGVYLCRAFLHVPCEGGFAVARKPWWLHAGRRPSCVVGWSVGPSTADVVVLGASGASPGSPKTVYDASLGGILSKALEGLLERISIQRLGAFFEQRAFDPCRDMPAFAFRIVDPDLQGIIPSKQCFFYRAHASPARSPTVVWIGSLQQFRAVRDRVL